MKKLSFLILTLLLLGCGSALAAEKLSLYVQPASADPGQMAAEAVTLYRKGSKDAYLFLPAGVDPAALRVFYSGVDSLTLDGEPIVSGQELDLSALVGQTVRLKGGSVSTSVKIMQSASIAALYLTTESGSLTYIEKTKGNREPGTLTVLYPDGETTVTRDMDYLKSRGNGTFEYSKKPYEIKLSEKAGLLGMAKAKHWILLANAKDNSLMRNKLCLDLALEVGMQYAVHSEFVDLYINHEYRGNYLLTEKVEVGKNRVAIADLEEATQAVNDQPLSSYKTFGTKSYKANVRKGYEIPNDPEDISGGYLLQLDLSYRYRLANSALVTKEGQPVVIKSPKHASKAQVTYISDRLQALENALFSKDGVNSATGLHYYDYIDKDSLALYMLLEETVKNYDANRSSLYLYKPADSQSTLLYAGPGWDFDQALDNYGFVGAKVTTAITSSTHYHWMPHAYRITDLRERMMALYQERFVPALAIMLGESDAGVYLRSIDTYEAQISASAAMNYTRWKYTSVDRSNQVGRTFTSNVAHIRTFMTNRRVWLNKWWIDGVGL